MDSEPVHAFLDAYGDPGMDLTKNKTTNLFIISAVIVKNENLEKIITQTKHIQKAYLKGAELKSSKIGAKFKLRKRILKEISKLEIQIVISIIDKEKLNSEGYKYKKSFYKNLHKPIHKIISDSFANLNIVHDQYGNKDFFVEYKKYIHKTYQLNLFDSFNINFQKSSSNVLIQIADFISGTIALHYDFKKKIENSSELIDIIKNKVIINHWPNYSVFIPHKDVTTDEYNPVISKMAFRSANAYLNEHNSSSDQLIQDRVRTLKYLLQNYNIDPSRYIPTGEILEVLFESSMKTHTFRTSIIGVLRSNDVLIVSNGNGYKLPCNKNDCKSFIEYWNTTIDPMLSRIKKFRDKIKIGTHNEIDVLEGNHLLRLKRAIEDDIFPKKNISPVRKFNTKSRKLRTYKNTN